MPRLSRRRLAAYAMASVFIVLLILELVAIFSPAFAGRRTPRLEVLVYAPSGYEAEATRIAEAVAGRLGGGYRLVHANSSVPAIAVVVVDPAAGPLLVHFTDPRLAGNPQDLGQYAEEIAKAAEQLYTRLPSNTTLVLLPNETLPVPRDMSLQLVEAMYAHAASMSNATGANATEGQS